MVELVTNETLGQNLLNNIIVGTPKLINTKIIFEGKGNILFFPKDGVTLKNSRLAFRGNNSVIFLSENYSIYLLNIDIFNNSIFYMGKNNYINNIITAIVAEQKNIIIGDDGLYSHSCCLQTSDAHTVYDCNTRERMNWSKSIYIGDHVWLGQHCLVLKGTKIGSGSIIGGMSVLSGKTIPSNCSFAGNPAKKLNNGIFFTKNCIYPYNDLEMKKNRFFDSNNYVYKYNTETSLPFSTITTAIRIDSQSSKQT
ncbi:MAG: acyltransferase [Lachnospiraceae bacterium]